MNNAPWLLEETASRHPRAASLVAPTRTLTYAQLLAVVTATSANLRQAGLEQGDVVAFLARPSDAYIAALLACFYEGIVACPLSLRLPPEAVRRALAQVRAKALVTDAPAPQLLSEGLPVKDLEDLVSWQGDGAPRPRPIAADLPATIIFTSGSSGQPKAALLSIGNHVANANLSNRNIALAPGDGWLLSLPLEHVSGLGIVFRCITSGAAVVVPKPGEELAQALARSPATHLSLVPTQLQRLLGHREGIVRLQRLKAILLGGSAIPYSLIREAVSPGLPIHTTYGLTEMASQVATTPPGAGLDALLTAGRPLHPGHTTVSREGEILVRGEPLFLGYVAGDRVERPIFGDGWFPTGDQGHFDPQGNLVVTGRRDNRFKSGGENVQPEMIERYLCAMDGVEQAVVVPVPNTEFGHVPAAFVRLKRGVNVSALGQDLALHLPRYMIPVRFLPWPEDLEGAMKISRQALAQRAAERIIQTR
jgi:o-succinylbenzoate---CoA ligase